MMTVIEFLTARLDEDEAMARASLGTHDQESRWSTRPGHPEVVELALSGGALIYDEGGHTAADAAHIARHDPASVLREVAAKRAILLSSVDESVHHGWSVMRALADIYSDHPDYADVWPHLGPE